MKSSIIASAAAIMLASTSFAFAGGHGPGPIQPVVPVKPVEINVTAKSVQPVLAGQFIKSLDAVNVHGNVTTDLTNVGVNVSNQADAASKINVDAYNGGPVAAVSIIGDVKVRDIGGNTALSVTNVGTNVSNKVGSLD